MDFFGLPTLDIESTLEPVTYEKMTTPSSNTTADYRPACLCLGSEETFLRR